MSRVIDRKNKRYNDVFVMERSGTDKHGHAKWLAECLLCGNIFTVLGDNLKTGNTKNCGCLRIKQSAERMRTRIISKETKRKMSEAKKGVYCGKDNPNWNPNLTDEDRLIKRNYSEYREWRGEVFERDDYTCQICKDRGVILRAHHIESFNSNKELRIVLENGITLCKDCHDDFHHQYGSGGNTRNQLEEFICIVK